MHRWDIGRVINFRRIDSCWYCDKDRYIKNEAGIKLLKFRLQLLKEKRRVLIEKSINRPQRRQYIEGIYEGIEFLNTDGVPIEEIRFVTPNE